MPSVTWTEPNQAPTTYVKDSIPAHSGSLTLFGPWMPMPIPGDDGWTECEGVAVVYIECSGTPVPWTEGSL